MCEIGFVNLHVLGGLAKGGFGNLQVSCHLIFLCKSLLKTT